MINVTLYSYILIQICLCLTINNCFYTYANFHVDLGLLRVYRIFLNYCLQINAIFSYSIT